MFVLFQLVWTIVCFACVAFHLYWTSSQFFRYEISTNVQLNIPDQIDLPITTVCFDIPRLLKWSVIPVSDRKKLLTKSGVNIYNFDRKNPEELEPNEIQKVVVKGSFFEHLSLISNLQSRVNITDQFKWTLSPDELFSQLAFYNPEKRQVELYGSYDTEEVLEKVTYFKGNRKCFMFKLFDNFIRNLNYATIRRQKIFSSMTGGFIMNNEALDPLEQAVFTMTSSDDITRTESTPFLLLPIKKNVSYIVTHNEYRTTLLPPPYATNCINYQTVGNFSSRGGCFESCQRTLSLKRFQKLHPSVSIFMNESQPILPLNDLYDMLETRSYDIDKKCNDQCIRKDCKSVLHIPRYLTGYRELPSLAAIVTCVSLTPITESVCHQQISLIQFLSDIASCLGFWCGLSALGVVGFLRDLKETVFCTQQSHSQSGKCAKRHQQLVLTSQVQSEAIRTLQKQVDNLSEQIMDVLRMMSFPEKA